jgi:NAD(P)-dependent dehydrogenase (short-subunit alcohol dehydrogenase family)
VKLMARTDDTPIPDYAGGLRLDGRGVAIIGAGQGIGRQAAHAAAAVGAKVACIDFDAGRAADVAEETGGVAVSGDATKPEDMERMLAEAQDRVGKLHAVVDILGMPRYVSLLKTTDEDWDFQVDITLKQAFYALRAGGRLLAENGGGALAFVSSISANSAPNHAPYGAAKAGLNSMIKSAAVELGRKGIRVNAVAPGVTWTPRISGRLTPEARATAEASIPLRRVGQPSDIASALLFIISDLASYITGQTLVVDGGGSCTYPLDLSISRS